MESSHWSTAYSCVCGLRRTEWRWSLFVPPPPRRFLPISPFPPLLPIPVSPCFVILLLGAGDSPRWRITAQLDRAAEPRDLSQLIFVSLSSSPPWTQPDCSRLIFNLLPFNKVRVRLDQLTADRGSLKSSGHQELCVSVCIKSLKDFSVFFFFCFSANFPATLTLNKCILCIISSAP